MLSGAMLRLIGLSQVSKPLSQALAIVTKAVSGVRLQVFDSSSDIIPSGKRSCKIADGQRCAANVRVSAELLAMRLDAITFARMKWIKYESIVDFLSFIAPAAQLGEYRLVQIAMYDATEVFCRRIS